MKKQFLFWLFTSLVVLLSSCSNDTSNNIESTTKQTILVYMPWTGSNSNSGLYNIFLQNLDSIESGIKTNKGLGDSRLIVFLSTSPSESSLYEVTYDNGAFKHIPIKSYTGSSYTTAEGISQIINDTKSAAYALNYAMIIGCHGTGWTYKADWVDYPNKAKSYEISTIYNDNSYVKTRFFGSVSDLQNYATDVEVLAAGLEQSGTKFQYILFDDCYMANVETAFMLKNVTNYLIGSTSEVIDLGMPYATMWKGLASATPNYDTIVSSFYDFYSNYKVKSGAISVIDCRQVENLASIMKDINLSSTFADSLRSQIQVLDGFHSAIFFDTGDYVDKLCANTTLKGLFNDQLKKVVKKEAHTEQIYSYLYPTGPKYIDIKTYSGITISDPTVNSAPIKELQQTGWWKATH